MTSPTSHTKKPSHRLPPAEGVVPTPCKEKNMPRMAQTADKVTPQQQEIIDRLDALEPGDSVNNGIGWYENAGPGLWSTDADSKSAEVHTSREIVLAATKTITVDRAFASIALPPRALEPNLARFNALVGDKPHGWIFNTGDGDPFWDGKCPPWCQSGPDGDHTIQGGYGSSSHRSRPITVLYANGETWEYTDGRLGHSHYEVSLSRPASSRTGTAWVVLGREHTLKEKGPVVTRLKPSEARELAGALLAAADLADPDNDFEEASK